MSRCGNIGWFISDLVGSASEKYWKPSLVLQTLPAHEFSAVESGLLPVREPVISAAVSAREGTQSLVLIYAEGPPPPDDTADNRPLILDQSSESFPPATIRVFSFSARPVAVKIGPTAIPVPPMRTVMVPYPDDRRTWLQIATVGEKGWRRVIGTPQTLGPRTRLSLFSPRHSSQPIRPEPQRSPSGKDLGSATGSRGHSWLLNPTPSDPQ